MYTHTSVHYSKIPHAQDHRGGGASTQASKRNSPQSITPTNKSQQENSESVNRYCAFGLLSET